MGFFTEPSPAPRLVALCGYKYAGKSTAARILSADHGYYRTRFAGPIKAAAVACGLPREAVDGPAAAKEAPLALLAGASGRQFQELLGDWGRATFGQDFWLRAWAEAAEDLREQGESLLLVDDLRYDNEDDFLAAWAEAHGLPYLLVQVSAPDREDARPTHSSNRVPAPERVARAIDNSAVTCPTPADFRMRLLHTMTVWEERLRQGLAPAAGRTPRW